MNPADKDEFAHALGQTMHFYGKELDKVQLSFWITACKEHSVSSLRAALLEYVKVGKYAPRPANVIELARHTRAQSATALPPPEQLTTNCPPEISSAWMWFIGRIAKGSSLESIFDSKSNIDIDTQEHYLQIVNQQARQYNAPESIPDEYKLPEVWRN